MILDENITITVKDDDEYETFLKMKNFIDHKVNSLEKTLKEEDERESNCQLESDSCILLSAVLSMFITVIVLICVCLIILFGWVLMVLFYPVLFWIPLKDYIDGIKLGWKNFVQDSYILKFSKSFLIAICILAILVIPAVLVVITQTLCVFSIFSLIEISDSSQISNLEVKWLLNVFFLLLSGKEAIQSIKTFSFFLLKIIYYEGYDELNMSKIGMILGVLPSCAQITMTFLIYYLSVIMIYVDQDMISFIENFAGFYIILEFDNIVINFLRIIDFYGLLIRVLKTFTDYDETKNYDAIKKEGLVGYIDQSNEMLIRIILDDLLKDVLTKENIQFQGEELKAHKENESWIFFAKIFGLLGGFSIVYFAFENSF